MTPLKRRTKYRQKFYPTISGLLFLGRPEDEKKEGRKRRSRTGGVSLKVRASPLHTSVLLGLCFLVRIRRRRLVTCDRAMLLRMIYRDDGIQLSLTHSTRRAALWVEVDNIEPWSSNPIPREIHHPLPTLPLGTPNNYHSHIVVTKGICRTEPTTSSRKPNHKYPRYPKDPRKNQH
ncbi:hypothetical protein BO85DRAFT_223888 [Aspergillus piperis CBS 112811]|uniref:Uncharacterized protein n=1 Tax=Aspergillus piperis CBS 112811 TaxID=1448313 RepID=A0A8G1R8S1_9EURO|nr:hypothetical protein BO85DRAFT_223888 [Aspergillus piperis CBS 112811]RAH60314.1 hypothetical protein BO85DRAFT_223888 [Aspergillus piperis CBS 112811]